MPGLYFHIPFCAQKCGYCDFYSFAPTEAQMDLYRDALCRSIANYAADVTEPFDSVYFGGGTPSFFGGERLKAVLCFARSVLPITNDAEITVECNPSSTALPLLQTLKAAGVNRISLGVQSALKNERSLLGRVSSAAQVRRAAEDCRTAGIGNLSLDLMLGIPAQTTETLDESLGFLLSLQPQHISDAYEAFIGMSNKRQMYLEGYREKRKKEIADSENRLKEAEEDPFSNFKGLSDKDIERIKAYKGPGIDELIEEMEE